jgi:hypothetical protein
MVVPIPLTIIQRATAERIIQERYRFTYIFDEPRHAYRGPGFDIDLYGWFCERKPGHTSD